MDYTEQRKFLRSSRMWGAGLVLVLSSAVGVCIQVGKISDSKLLALYAALAFALTSPYMYEDLVASGRLPFATASRVVAATVNAVLLR